MKPLLLFIPLIGWIPGSTTTYTAPPPVAVEATVTAYTSSVEETDEDPFTMASGERVRKGALACPSKYKFGQLIQIGDQYFTCLDRMNARYRDTERFDIWMESKSEALEWGKQQLTVLVHN